MYSNLDIEEVIKSGDLIIDPLVSKQIKSAGLTLHLGKKLLKPKKGIIVDVKNKVIPDYDEIILNENEPYILQPQEFLLGHTYEKVTVGSKLGFFIEGRSTLARVGLTIVQTAMLVYPGHRNRVVTLELANHGVNPIKLYLKMKIARVAIFELKTPTNIEYDNDGKYRNQDSVGEPIFEDELL